MPFEPLLLGSASKAASMWPRSTGSAARTPFPMSPSPGTRPRSRPLRPGQGAADRRWHRPDCSTNDAYVLNNLLGFKFKVINGYPGPAEIDFAMATGKLEGRATAGWTGLTTRHPDWLAEKKVNILYQTGFVKYPSIPDSVPSLLDLAGNRGAAGDPEAEIRIQCGRLPLLRLAGGSEGSCRGTAEGFCRYVCRYQFKAAAAAQKVDVFSRGP